MTKEQRYQEIISQSRSLFTGIKSKISNLANASALLNQYLEDINWVGFYLLENNQLELGPFQGKPACIIIPLGKGVCGTSAKANETIIVKNVHDFPGHIACDSASNSEIVIPIHVQGNLYGVLDIDSPSIARFDEVDKIYLEAFVQELEKHLNS